MTTLIPDKHPRAAAGAPASTGGRFIPAAKGESGAGLMFPGQAHIRAEVVLQAWQNDYAINVGQLDFDVQAALDTLDLDQVRHLADNTDRDSLIETAIAMKLVDKVPGPYSVHLDEDLMETYIGERERTGQLRGNLPAGPTVEEATAEFKNLTQGAEAAQAKAVQAALAAARAVVLDEYPMATTLVVNNPVADDGEISLSPVRVLDAEGNTLWESDGDMDVWQDLADITIYLDRDYSICRDIERDDEKAFNL